MFVYKNSDVFCETGQLRTLLESRKHIYCGKTGDVAQHGKDTSGDWRVPVRTHRVAQTARGWLGNQMPASVRLLLPQPDIRSGGRRGLLREGNPEGTGPRTGAEPVLRPALSTSSFLKSCTTSVCLKPNIVIDNMFMVSLRILQKCPLNDTSTLYLTI